MRSVIIFMAAAPISVLAAPIAHHHHSHVHRRPSPARLHLSGEISAASPLARGLRTPPPALAPRREFADDTPPLAAKDDLGSGTTASVGLQSLGKSPVADPSDMPAAAQGMRQPASGLVGAKLSHPF